MVPVALITAKKGAPAHKLLESFADPANALSIPFSNSTDQDPAMTDRTNERSGRESDVSRRDFLQRLGTFGALGLSTFTLLACGGSGEENGASAATSGNAQSSAGGDVAKTVTLHPQGNQMKYKETEFTVPAGETVKLVFDNTATSPSMQHNVVIAASNSDGLLKKIGQAGTQAGSTNDYVPQEGDLTEQILAHTPMSKPGETVSVTFTTPSEPGDYGYVCTFPGHWATMQGTMIVEK